MQNTFPKKCPQCGESLLDIPTYLYDDWLVVSAKSKPIWICTLKCSQSNCDSKVICAFEAWEELQDKRYTWSKPNFDDKEHHTNNSLSIEMLWVYPSMRLHFEQPETIPKEIRQLLSDAFDCMCTNKLLGAGAYARTCIFSLLDDQEIESQEEIIEKDGKKISREISTVDRLDILKNKYPPLESYINNLKTAVWIANDLIHQNIEWDYQNVLLSLQNVTLIIDKIYVEKTRLEKQFGQFSNARGQRSNKAIGQKA